MKKPPTIEEVDALIAQHHAGEFRKLGEDEICKIFGVDPVKVAPLVEERRQLMESVEREERGFLENVSQWLKQMAERLP